jgi:hypothetical protein
MMDAKDHPAYNESIMRAKVRRDQDQASYNVWFDGISCFVRAYEAALPDNSTRVFTAYSDGEDRYWV